MKIKDIPDAKRYLENDCYCPHEVYSPDGFFYQLIDPELECKQIGDNEQLTAVIVKPKGEGADPQIVVFWKYKDNPKKIGDSIRYDATENNIKQVKAYAQGKITKANLDSFDPERDKKALEKVFALADAIIID